MCTVNIRLSIEYQLTEVTLFGSFRDFTLNSFGFYWHQVRFQFSFPCRFDTFLICQLNVLSESLGIENTLIIMIIKMMTNIYLIFHRTNI